MMPGLSLITVGQAVSGAGCVGNDVAGIFVEISAFNEHQVSLDGQS